MEEKPNKRTKQEVYLHWSRMETAIMEDYLDAPPPIFGFGFGMWKKASGDILFGPKNETNLYKAR